MLTIITEQRIQESYQFHQKRHTEPKQPFASLSFKHFHHHLADIQNAKQQWQVKDNTHQQETVTDSEMK